MRGANRRSAILAGVALAALAIGAGSLTHPVLPPANAQDAAASGRTELQKAIASLQPRASLDTTPIEFSVGGIHFRVPRNYLTTMDNWNGGPQGLVTIGLAANSGSLVYVDGAGDGVAGNSGTDVVGLAGIGTNATVSGPGYVGLVSSDESLALANSGASAATANNTTGETIEASGATVYFGAGSAGTVLGNGTNIGLVANSGSLVYVEGSGDGVVSRMG